MNQTALVASAVDPDVAASLQIYERLKPLKDALGVQNLTDSELQVFAIVARHTGLDPFTKQIYAIKRGGRVTHQTGIDGYRSVAERTKQYGGSDEPEFEACECGQDDSPKDHPKLARVVVHRIRDDGHVVDQVGVARWHELKPPHVKFQNANDFQDSMWWKQPYGQLAKCGEANGLRKAFPRVLGGVYISDEVQGSPIVEGEAREVDRPSEKPTTRERIAARRAEKEGQQPAAEAEVPADIFGTAEAAADTVEGTFAEAASSPTTAPEPDVDLVDTLRAAAAASDLEGNPTAGQRTALARTFAGVSSQVTLAGIRALWPTAVTTDGTAALSAAQAHAVLIVAETLGVEFIDQWRTLAERTPAAAA